MSKFIIEPHFRLHEWVAGEKGYFRAEGLDYEFLELVQSSDGRSHIKPDRVGAFHTIADGRKSDISCACHWTVNVAASNGHGKLYADAYSVSPAGVFVPRDSPIMEPRDLAGVPISVGYQSGSHYSTIQALEQYLKPAEINLSFGEGLLFKRMELLIDGKTPGVLFVQWPLLFRRAAGIPEGHRHDIYDCDDDHGRSRSGRCEEIFPRAEKSPAGYRPAPRALYASL